MKKYIIDCFDFFSAYSLCYEKQVINLMETFVCGFDERKEKLVLQNASSFSPCFHLKVTLRSAHEVIPDGAQVIPSVLQ